MFSLSPRAGKEPAGGREAGSTVDKYLATVADCHVALGDWLKSLENPPPLPNWSVAISELPTCCPMNLVAPTAVTQGEDAGHDGHRATCDGGPVAENVVEFVVVLEVTVVYSVHWP